MTKWAIFSLFFCFLLIVSVFSTQASASLTDPDDQPPENNTPGYLNISGDNQAKRGALRLGTSDTSAPFNYQLEVLGNGAMIRRLEVDNNLMVSESTATLFVDAANDQVCIGPCLNIADSKLEVSGGGMYVAGGNNTGVKAVSSDSEAFYGYGEGYGIQGVSSSTNSWGGVFAVNTLGTALEGINTSNNYSAVAGISNTNIGVYGININPLSLWSGYFQGILESNSDVSGAKFLAADLQRSLIPFTSGQTVKSYNLGNIEIKHFDGTYLWATDSGNLIKIRAEDGFKIFEQAVVSGYSYTDVLFDGINVWLTANHSSSNDLILKVDPYSGAEICRLDLGSSSEDPQGIAFDGQYYWVTAAGSGNLIKLDNACVQQSGSPKNITSIANSLGKIVYNGTYLWVVSSAENAVININPSNLEAVRWDGLVGNNPQDIFFDNYFYWVVNKDVDTITSYYLSSSKVCSQAATTSCQTDDDCSGLGACFAVPQQYGTYSTGDGPSLIAFDGTYLWVANETDQSLTRLLATDPVQTQNFSLGLTPTGLLFDGTYLSVSSNTGLTKIYSGTGYGSTDLSNTLTLQNNSTLIKQSGSFSVSGSGSIGGGVTAEGDLVSSGNIWGQAIAGDTFESDVYRDTWTTTGDLTGATLVWPVLGASNGDLYAGTYPNGNVFKSTDEGATWNNTGNLTDAVDGDASYVYSLLEASNGDLYAGTYPNGNVYKSTDGGTTWGNTDDLFNASAVYALIEAGNGILYAGTFGNGDVFKSTDEGATWNNTGNLTDAGTNAGTVYSLLEASNGDLYAGTYPNGNVFKSTDEGATWNNTGNLTDAVDGDASYVYSLLEASNGDLYAGTYPNGNVYKSTDGGITWNNTGNLTGATNVYSLLEASNGEIFAGTNPAGVYQSTDGGATWNAVGDLSSVSTVYSVGEASNGEIYIGTALTGKVFQLEFVGLAGGTYTCPAGHFVTNVAINSLGGIWKIECRPL